MAGAGGRPRMRLGNGGGVSCTHTTCISSHPTHIFLFSLRPPSQPPSVPGRMDLQSGLPGLDLCCPSLHARGAHAHSFHAAPHTTSPRPLERGGPHHPNLQAVLVVTAVPMASGGMAPLSLLLLQTSLSVLQTLGARGRPAEAAPGPRRSPFTCREVHHLLQPILPTNPPASHHPGEMHFWLSLQLCLPINAGGKRGIELEAGEGERILAAQIEDKVSSSASHLLPEHLPPPPPVSAPARSLWASRLALSIHLPPPKADLSDPELLLKPQGHWPLGLPLLTLASERIEAPPTSTLRVDSL